MFTAVFFIVFGDKTTMIVSSAYIEMLAKLWRDVSQLVYNVVSHGERATLRSSNAEGQGAG